MTDEPADWTAEPQTVTDLPRPQPAIFQPIPNQVQLVMAVFVPDKGWLTTKRGMIYGGRHGNPPLLDLPFEELRQIVGHEVDSGLRAMQYRVTSDEFTYVEGPDGKPRLVDHG